MGVPLLQLVALADLSALSVMVKQLQLPAEFGGLGRLEYPGKAMGLVNFSWEGA